MISVLKHFKHLKQGREGWWTYVLMKVSRLSHLPDYAEHGGVWWGVRGIRPCSLRSSGPVSPAVLLEQAVFLLTQQFVFLCGEGGVLSSVREEEVGGGWARHRGAGGTWPGALTWLSGKHGGVRDWGSTRQMCDKSRGQPMCVSPCLPSCCLTL